jgi:hypothetical protein
MFCTKNLQMEFNEEKGCDMRAMFRSYYELSEDEIKGIWSGGLFVPDASILLGLYRYTEATRIGLLQLFTETQERLWIPHQYALEYHRNRASVAREKREAYGQVIEILNQSKTILENKINEKVGKEKHPYISSQSILRSLDRCIEKEKKKLIKQEQEHEAKYDKRSIDEKVAGLFSGRVGRPYDEKQAEALYKEGARRFEKKIPPGYEDRKGKTEPEMYGDLVGWKQILDIAKSTKKPVVLITDERKEDWWEKLDGEIRGPRPELPAEMWECAEVDFLMYRVTGVLEKAPNYLGIEIDSKALDDAKADEKASAVYRYGYSGLPSPQLPYSYGNQFLTADMQSWEQLRNALSLPNLGSTVLPGSDLLNYMRNVYVHGTLGSYFEAINGINDSMKSVMKTLYPTYPFAFDHQTKDSNQVVDGQSSPDTKKAGDEKEVRKERDQTSERASDDDCSRSDTRGDPDKPAKDG